MSLRSVYDDIFSVNQNSRVPCEQNVSWPPMPRDDTFLFGNISHMLQLTNNVRSNSSTAILSTISNQVRTRNLPRRTIADRIPLTLATCIPPFETTVASSQSSLKAERKITNEIG